MARFDNVGMWWEDFPVERKANSAQAFVRRIEVPHTGWEPPREFPNLKGVKLLGLDTETKDLELTERGPGFVRGASHAVGVSVATEDRAWYFPVRHEYEPQQSLNMNPARVFEWLSDQLRDTTFPVVGANLLYDLEVLRSEGVELGKHKWLDVQYAEPLLDESARTYNLDVLARKYLRQGKLTPTLYDWCSKSFGGEADEKQRKNIWRSPPTLVGPYAESDALLPCEILYAQRIKLEDEGLTDLFDLESRLIPLLLDMRFKGVRIDEDKANQTALWLRDKAREAQSKIPAVDVWSNDSVARAFDQAGLEYARTEAGNPSFTKVFLESVAHLHPLAASVLDVRLYEKAANPFVESYLLGNIHNGRVHCQFHPLRSDTYGTVAGRFCVHKETRIWTNEGIFPICTVPVGAKVTTHKGRQRRILARIFKGVESMFRVTLANGAHVTCTANHRMLTHAGWKKAKDISIGDSICGDVLSQFVTSTDTAASEGQIQIGLETVRTVSKINTQQDIQTAQKDSVLALKIGEQKPHDRKTTRTTSQLERKLRRWRRIFNACALRWKTLFRASFSNDESAEAKTNTKRMDGTSCKWKQEKQQVEQSSSDDTICARTLTSSPVISIEFVGASEVWDIEVEEDHSYIAQGIVHHNSSSNPNLQNIPSRHKVIGPMLRSLFIPEDGCRWKRADYSQVEFRLLAHHAIGPGSEELRERYRTDPNTDFHQLTIDMVNTITGILLDRTPAKNINFGNVYGMGKEKCIRSLGVSAELGIRFYEAYHEALPCVRRTAKSATRLGARRGYIKTVLGRRRRFPDEDSARTALNNCLQGSSADIIKKAMVDCYESGIYEVTGTPLLQVHDELDFDDDGSPEAAEAFAEAKHVMETCIPLRIPLRVDFSDGQNWAEAH